jgi:molybdopterin converting factor small subunit
LEVFKDKSVKYFLNLTEIIDTNIFLKDGDEIAFLPPVTGG